MITLTREEAQQVLDALQCATPPTFSTKLVEDWQSAVEFLRARLAQPEPEPAKLLLIPALMEQAGWVRKREWQGLTDEELKVALWESGMDGLTGSREDVARAIEAKLKEKNNGR
jgi:hypothetical protein